MAASYFATFIAYLVVSFMELLAWVVFVFGHPQWLMIWAPTFGNWGSIIVYMIPVLLALLHLILPVANGGIEAESTKSGYANDIFLIIGGGVMWIFHAVMHLMYTSRFMEHAKTI